MAASDLGSARRARLAAARLYLVCDATPGGRELADVIRAAVAGGVDVVQLRDKQLGDDELAAVANAARALCERLGALLIVNDRPLVALEAGADGVHVGQDDMPVADVRALLGADMLIGLSTHAESEIDDAVPHDSDGAPLVDYIGVGPVHETPTKPGRPAVGVELVRYAAAHAAVPFFAIGGLDDGQRRRRARRRRAPRRRAARDRRRRGSRGRRARAARQARRARVSARVPVPDDGRRVRGAEAEELARAALSPLGEHERPLALLVAIGVCVVLAIAVLAGAASIHDLSRHGGSLPGAVLLAVVLALLAQGMYRRRYWAVLSFEALLAFQIIVTSLALVVASTLLAAASASSASASAAGCSGSSCA